MNCPVCGADLENKKVCECGWEEKEETKVEEVVNETTEQVLPESEDKIFNIEGVDDESLAAVFGTPEELDEYLREYEIDFKKIQEEEQRQKTKLKKKKPWGVAIVSFISGVLATLIVIGSFNGTIVNMLDRAMYGSPDESIKNFTNAMFEVYDAKKVVKESSTYFLNDFTNGIVDPEDATAYFEEYFMYALYNNSLINAKFNKIINSRYIKNGTEEFDEYVDEYEALGNEEISNTKKITAFYNALVELEVQGSNETYTAYLEFVCVKIDGDWLVHSY